MEFLNWKGVARVADKHILGKVRRGREKQIEGEIEQHRSKETERQSCQ
jgi:hypothetical protein